MQRPAAVLHDQISLLTTAPPEQILLTTDPLEQVELGYNASDQLQNAWHIHLNVISNPTPSVIIFYIRPTLVVPW